ncbi:MAG: hypothetical protein Q8K32_19885 [Archangium sp.]|nr:hypothetical protein [Archangium sp.]
MPLMRLVSLAAAVWLLGCPTEPSPYVEPPDSPLDLTLFPVVTGGSRLFADVAGARLEFDPTVKDAIVALGQCVDATTYCYAPGTSKSVSWCLQNTRTCATEAPWNEKPCCPQACKDAFETAVDGGVAPADAVEQVFFVDKACFPGLREALEVP